MTTNSAQLKNGRYSTGGKSIIEDGFLKYWDKYSFPKSETDSTYTIDRDMAGRPDKLSYALYGDSDLAWFILQYNDIIDITEEFIEGAQLYIPTKSRIQLELLKNRV